MEHRDAATYGIWLHAVAIKPNSSKDHQAVAPKSRDFFREKRLGSSIGRASHRRCVCVFDPHSSPEVFFPEKISEFVYKTNMKFARYSNKSTGFSCTVQLSDHR